MLKIMNNENVCCVIPWEVADLVVYSGPRGICRLAFRRQDEELPDSRVDGHLLPGREDRRAEQVRSQLLRYLAGENVTWRVPLDLSAGTLFQQRVWRALIQIPYGETRTYGNLAASLGQPGASRAVGNAAGANPVPVIVPCHRLVAVGGRIGGFSAGLEIKRALLHLEGSTF